YFMKFYGSAAGPFMKRYWMGIDEAFANMKCESGSFFALHLVYTPQFLRQLAHLVRQAAGAAGEGEIYSARIAMTSEGLKNAEQYIHVRDAMNRGDFAAAKKVYDELYARNEAELSKGYGNHYTLGYLKRFVGTHVLAGAEAAAQPNKVLQVLGDRMKLAYDPEGNGAEQGYHRSDFDDSKWRQVATYSTTLNAQGLPDVKSVMWHRTSMDVPRRRGGRLVLFFTEVDGQAVTVYVNGLEVASLEREARRKPFEVDVTDAAEPGKNTVAIRVDHRRITELFLGGIVRPILLIHKADR
ncbi:MAG: beta galactosidase jelly roll domain-containing protein, partial [Planctomycetes bacterium]|nr:beta galactosidase jelly roll domain-containing protein [Planctomycetota bacterium]